MNFVIAIVGPERVRFEATDGQREAIVTLHDEHTSTPETETHDTIYVNASTTTIDQRLAAVNDADGVLFVARDWSEECAALATWYVSDAVAELCAHKPVMIMQLKPADPNQGLPALPRNALENAPGFCGAFSGSAQDMTSVYTAMRAFLKYPASALWDSHVTCFTVGGYRALRRSFWVLDEDRDGVLNDHEVSVWYHLLFRTASDKEISSMKTFLSRQETALRDGNVTVEGFLAVCQALIRDKKQVAVWRMLYSHGCGRDALPYADEELEALMLPDAAHTYQLSLVGELFFTDLPNRFPSMEALWSFVPPCPWGDSKKASLSQAEFVLRWRNEAIVNHCSVAQFARFWDFKEPLENLFVRRKKRQARAAGGSAHNRVSSSSQPPSVVRALIVGAPKCGKTSIVRHVTSGAVIDPAAEDDAEGQQPEASVTQEHVLAVGEKCVTLIDINDDDVVETIGNAAFMSTVDLLLLVFDGSDPYSFSYIAKVHEMVHNMRYRRLPMLIILSKIDLGVVEQEDIDSPDIFCAENNLLWPPLITTVVDPAFLPAEMRQRNEASRLAELVVEVAENPELAKPDTMSSSHDHKTGWRRLLRGRNIVLSGAVLTGLYLISKLLSRKKRT
eukprot:PhM_4_TR14371/c0_g1_i1/m.98126/K07870/RHOT1, ARHT1; mitochondrial Rho GTPase 1